MSNELAKTKPMMQAEVIERALMGGDLSSLNVEQRLSYYKNVCDSLGLNHLTKPFDFLKNKKNGHLTLYANANCAQQLRDSKQVSINIVGRERFDTLFVVTARAVMANGRTDESVGAVDLKNLKGEDLANAVMKTETKAKRRVTLSICGLGMLDESEVNDNPAIFMKVDVTAPAKMPDLKIADEIINTETGEITSRNGGGDYRYLIPYNNSAERTLAKQNGARWDGETKQWTSSHEIAALASFLVGPKPVFKSELDAAVGGDDIPEAFYEGDDNEE